MSEDKSVLTINESHFPLKNGEQGTIAVFMYAGEYDPVAYIDRAIRQYTEGHKCWEFVDASMDNPWARVIISDINDMKQVPFDENVHKIKPSIKRTSKEWFELTPKEHKLVIVNPDGWDRENYEYSFNEELVTKEEFGMRISNSTIQCDYSFFEVQ